ncbi:MAG: polysaccharide biosynthesis tyrosine autokinase [Alphaproteobacteria bacterium]|jgi:succinoglycan biosynthesis transport protein ExoP|nr:polysaccharide biosynthesis tyrosine autokinase [Alphaproteobacteria bacterium]
MADTGARSFDLTEPLSLGDQNGEDSGGLRRIIEAFQRRLWVFLLIAGATLFVVLLFTLTATRQYTATADVQLDVRNTQLVERNMEVFEGLTTESVMIDTETEVMRSAALAARVVDALNLTQDPAFAPIGGPSLGQRVQNFFFGGGERMQDEEAIRAVTIENLREHVDIRRHGMTLIIRVSATLPDAARAAEVANAFAENYLTMQLETKYETIRAANEFIATRLAVLREEVLEKERLVEEERARAGLLSAEGATLTEQAMTGLQAEVGRAEADLAAAQARLQGVQAGETSAEALGSAVVGNLRAQQAELARQRAVLSNRYGARHPEMQRVEREIADLDARIAEEIARITENLRTEVRIAQQRLNSIRGNINNQQTSLVRNNRDSVRLRDLERDADASRTTYEGFLARFRQVAETSGIERPDARVISQAAPPLGPSTPNTRLNLLMGVILGAALGAVGVFLVEALEQSLRTPEDVKARLGLPWVGSVPFLDRRARTIDGELLSPEDFVVKRPLSAFGEALRTIRASVFFANPDRRVKVLAVTSALPDEGKTTLSIGLARISALAGSKTVLVDCDLRRRSATHSLGLEAEKGLTEVLFRTATLNEVIQKDPSTGVDVVPLAQAEFTPRDLFGSEAMRSLLDALRARYDVIILDNAPVMPIADSRVLAGQADAVLLVARWGSTPASIVRAAAERIRAHGGRISGVVLEAVESGLVSRLLYDKNDYYSELYHTYYIS